MKNKALYILLFILVFNIELSEAQTSINLEEYVNLVLKLHPEMSISALKTEMIELEIAIANRREDPTIEIAYAHNAESRVFQGPGMEASLSVPIDWWKTRNSRKNIATSQWNQVKLESKLSEAELKKIAREVYVNAWIHLEMERVIEDYTQSIEDLFQRDSIQYALGALSEIDFQQTKIEKDKAIIDLLNYKEERNNSEIIFGLLLNEGIGVFQPKELPIKEIKNLPSWSDIAKFAWLLLEQDEIIKEHEEELKLLEKERKLNPELILGVERHFFNDPLLNDRFSEAKWTIGMNIPLPFSNKNKAPLVQQQKRIEKKELERKALSMTLHQDFQSTINALKTAQQKVNTFDDHLLNESDQWLQKMEIAYSTGHLNWINYINAQNNWRDLKLEYLDNLMHLWQGINQLLFWMEQVPEN